MFRKQSTKNLEERRLEALSGFELGVSEGLGEQADSTHRREERSKGYAFMTQS